VVDLDGEGGEAWRRPALSCGSGGREKRRERFKKKRRPDYYCVDSGAIPWDACLTGLIAGV
jgi:hypothetical protein